MESLARFFGFEMLIVFGVVFNIIFVVAFGAGIIEIVDNVRGKNQEENPDGPVR